MASKSSLYKVSHHNTSKPTTADPTTSSLAFSNTLTSLLTQGTSNSSTKSSSTSGRIRPSKSTKGDIFTAHNRNHRKCTAAAVSNDDPTHYAKQRHKISHEVDNVDDSSLARSKRRMEEKAKLYASMKRGEYVPPKGKEHLEESQLVDFDRKWAEKELESQTAGDDSDPDSDADSSVSAAESLMDYTDSLGRTRQLSRFVVQRLQQRDAAASHASEELANFAARPQRPSNVIHGDTVQFAAFNPDAAISTSMAELASKRDHSVTPPPEVHYDASKEVRSKGVGFYQFSQDEEMRKKEFEALEKQREETERRKEEDEERKSKRRREEEERKRIIQKRREERLAERFLKAMEEPS